ncbi:MAG: exo-alpha-sialidase [Pirellula sp.]|nr:exo-alpha-sialidase [Pirellula sp.]
MPPTLPRPVAARWSLPAAIALLLLFTAMPADAADTAETVPFRAGTDGYFAFRIPALVTSTRGTLLAFCEGRKTSLSDDGDNDLVLRRSFDAGRTWGPLQLVHEEGGDAVVTIGNPCAVVDRTTGVVWLTMNRENGRVLVTSSSDDGQTWAPPRDITTDVSRPGPSEPEWGWYAMGPGCGIQLTVSNGTASGSNHSHPGRLVIPANHRTTPDRSGPSSSHVIYSDDHGRSWHVGGTVGPHTNECQLAELGDGRLLINCRNHRGKAPGNPNGKPELAGRRITAVSSDAGLTWSEPTLADALVEPTCQAGLIRLAKPSADGHARLIFTNPASKTARTHMTIRLSDDDGATWPRSLLLEAGSSGYSSPAELADGRIGVLYERARSREIAFRAVALEELTADP